jgi:serpin B
MKRLAFLFLVVPLLLPLACGPGTARRATEPENPAKAEAPDDPPSTEPEPDVLAADPADVAALARGNNEFAFDLYGRLRQGDGNIICSPFSISSALAMTYAGARGPTAEEMAKTLHFTVGQERLPPAFAGLLRGLRGARKSPSQQLLIANALWEQQGFPFRDEFRWVVRDDYRGALNEVDFAGDTEGARQTINRWVAQQTRDKVPELLKPGVLDDHTRLVLTNAIYFHSKWATPFAAGQTKDEPFLTGAGERVTAPLMHLTAGFRYAEADDVQVLELPYEGKRLAMVVVLPHKPDGLAAVEKAMTAARLQGWLAKLTDHEVIVTLPKLKVAAEFRPRPELEALGMSRAFSGRADFSGISPQEGLLLKEVVHQACADVDEKGTTAAAATAVIGQAAAEPPVHPWATFRADHPFVFLIRDAGTGSILFLGRVTNPMP